MSFLNYGSSKGLAYRHDFGADMDRLYEQEKFRAQTKAQKEEKVRYYSTLLKQHNPVSPGIVKGLEGHVQTVNQELADFAINNPNWEQDPGLFAKFQGITDKYINNDFVRNDFKSQEQLEVLRQNQSNMPEDEFIREMDRYNEFYQNGGDPYVFNGRIDPSYDDIFATSSQLLAGSETQTSVQNKETGMWWNVQDINRDADPMKNSAMGTARLDYSDPVKRRVIEKRFAQYNEQNPGLYQSALQFHSAMLQNSYGRKATILGGQMNSTKGTEDGEDNSPLKNLFFNQNIASGFIPDKTITAQDNMEVFVPGWRKKGETYSPKNTDRVYVKKSDGSYEQIQLNGAWELAGVNNIEVKEDNGYMAITIKSAQPTVSDAHAGVGYSISFGGKEYKGTVASEIIRQIKADNGLKGNQEKDLLEQITELNKSKEFGTRNLNMTIGSGSGKQRDIDVSVSMIEDPTLTSRLEGWGFQSQGIVSEAQIEMPMQGKRVSYPTFSGTVYVPMDMTPQSIAAYEQTFGTKHAEGLLESGALANIQNTFSNMLNSAIRPNVNGGINVNDAQINASMDFLTQNVGGKPTETLRDRSTDSEIKIGSINASLTDDQIGGIVNTPWYMSEKDGNRIVRQIIDFDKNTTSIMEYDTDSGEAISLGTMPIDKGEYLRWYIKNREQIYKGRLRNEG